MSKITKKSPSWIIIVYLTLTALVLACTIWQLAQDDAKNASYCLSALIMLALPQLAQRLFKVKLPGVLELIIYIFIITAQIFGEVFNLYDFFPPLDSILHIINGFICAAIGFSLFSFFSKDPKKAKLSPFYLGVVAVCFSITIGVLWEFVEFSIDSTLRKDMQKDRIVTSISSIALDETHTNTPVNIDDIIATDIKTASGEVITIEGGFLDIGIIDTMKDLFADFIGSLIFAIMSVLYIKDDYQGKLARYFLPTRAKSSSKSSSKDT